MVNRHIDWVIILRVPSELVWLFTPCFVIIRIPVSKFERAHSRLKHAIENFNESQKNLGISIHLKPNALFSFFMVEIGKSSFTYLQIFYSLDYDIPLLSYKILCWVLALI